MQSIDDFPFLIGNHPLVLKIKALVRKMSVTHASTLVIGESGTGKELVARAIHAHSPLADRPLIAVNCGAIPSELLESELFGHERGAFTGAIRARAGLFQVADGGTVFLDEVGDMSPGLQVKLLRALQDGEIRPVGADRSRKVNVRVIAATSKDLALEIKRHAFREDLFYRLNVIPITIPPLRERRSDIPRLIEHYLAQENDKCSRLTPIQFDAEVSALLEQYDWPGNVRELRNIVERMVILCEGTVVIPDNLPSNIQQFLFEARIPKVEVPSDGFDFYGATELYENRLIDEALRRTNGNKQAAAHILGLKRTTLVAKLHRRPGGPAFEERKRYSAEVSPLTSV